MVKGKFKSVSRLLFLALIIEICLVDQKDERSPGTTGLDRFSLLDYHGAQLPAVHSEDPIETVRDLYGRLVSGTSLLSARNLLGNGSSNQHRRDARNLHGYIGRLATVHPTTTSSARGGGRVTVASTDGPTRRDPPVQDSSLQVRRLRLTSLSGIRVLTCVPPAGCSSGSHLRLFRAVRTTAHCPALRRRLVAPERLHGGYGELGIVDPLERRRSRNPR